MTNNQQRSVEFLRQRLDALDDALHESLTSSEPPRLARDASYVITGAGGSEGPARVLAGLLARAGTSARFEPLSAYQGDPPQADHTVVFSHGLSPNAQLAIERSPNPIVVGATKPERGRWVQHGPKRETGLLVRVLAR